MAEQPEQLGPYRVGRQLGKGGMGRVFEAVHAETGKRVAVKALSPELAAAEGFRERFQAEIDSLRILRHEGIVELYGYGQQDQTLFYAMEVVDGASLEDELRAGRRFDWREVTQIAIQLCRALKHAHDHGVIHRDIKPANVLIDAADRVKLADFGIARLFGGTQLTLAGGVVGTADFMSPEQADGRPITHRCDQYSLGCVMYTLLAGRPPFRAESLPQMLQLQRFAEQEPVTRYARETPEQLSGAIDQLLAKTPEARFPNTVVLARHLEAMQLALSRPGVGGAEEGWPGEGETAAAIDGRVGAAGLSAPAGGACSPELAATKADAHVQVGGSGEPSVVSRNGSEQEEAEGDLQQGVATPPRSGSAEGQEVRVAADAGESPHAYTGAERSGAPREYTDVQSAAEDPSRPSRLALAGQVLALVGVICVIGYGAYQALRPATADELFARLTNASEQAWESAEPGLLSTLRRFDERFPNDPRATRLEPRREQVALVERSRRLRSAALLGGENRTLSAAERVYVDALRLARTRPGVAAERFCHLAELLSGPGVKGQDDDLLGRLASRQAKRFGAVAAAAAAERLPFARSRLAAAERAAATDPAAARRLCDALIALYEQEAWAAGLVERASALRARLTSDGGSATDVGPSDEFGPTGG